MPPHPDVPTRLRDLASAWADASANERASFQPWLLRFCEALGVPAPEPPTDAYRFELPVAVIDREGRQAVNFIDCWKAGHFAIEAKAFGEGLGNDALLRKAYGQVRNYVAHVPGDAPPYLMVVDVPRTLMVWDRWSGSYGDFAAGRRIALSTLNERADEIALLYDIFTQPKVRDPRGQAQAVTKEIAGELAQLAAELESRGLETERVARFLMRCVFSCFAEDVELLPANLFRRTLETAGKSGDPEHLARALTSLWQTMDAGGMFGADMLHRFNGHFFRTVEALPLAPADLELLIRASRHDWSKVEPSIFGTLLVRALDPEERHRLGAEYTPRAYIERLVEPTVVEPIREKWTAVQAVVLQLEEADTKKGTRPRAPSKATGRTRKDRDTPAVRQLREFHEWLRGLRFLDPACGSGNFLYVPMAAVKRIEMEVLNEIARLEGGQRDLTIDEVHPRQFFGIEVKPWAREIAELTLWIGYHQFWRETHGGRPPREPILEDTGTIECRDAVLAWDEIVHRPEKDRPDPTPRIVHPVTGELVPDPNARLPYYAYVGARQAEWPGADFIIGNPPYVGNKRMRTALGDGYVDALRAVYPDLPEGVDLVMFWWWRAADLIASRRVIRAGLITTNSITQISHQPIVTTAHDRGAKVIWAVRDHPWSDESDDAAVRVAMTVLSVAQTYSTLVIVDKHGSVVEERRSPRFNSDLTIGADIARASAVPLLSNSGLSFRGFTVVGSGFLLDSSEAKELQIDETDRRIITPYVNGRDLAQRSRNKWIIDFGLMTEEEARYYSRPFDIVRSRVKPERDTNNRASYRRFWWRFAEARPALRSARSDLQTVIVSPYVSRFRHFQLTSAATAPDDTVVVICSSSPWIGGVLSSAIHSTWARSAGTRLGVGNDPRYNNPRCFDPFPFPERRIQNNQIESLFNRISEQRKASVDRHERVTFTGMYNVVEKLRSGEPLSPKERATHEIAACGVLRDLHDELDAAVAEAYGWTWPMEKEEILERLVALHDERVEEEKRGLIRWLRPDYQVPRFAPEGVAPALALERPEKPAVVVTQPARTWPTTAVEQLAALGAFVAQRPVTPDDVVAHFSGAKRDLVARHLETLALMGEVTVDESGRYQAARKVA